jgi:uncharacterized membrane protein
MDWESVVALIHVAAAVSALVLGAAVILRKKGTSTHRALGSGYVALLLVVNVAALSLHREATFGVFHVLSLVSLVTVLIGVVPLVMGSRSPVVIARHAYFMAWSYAGLVAAGVGQLGASRLDGSRLQVFAVIGGTLAVCGGLIAWRVPRAVASTLGG